MRSRAEWRKIPVLVVAAKDLTTEEHAGLTGDVERVLLKGANELHLPQEELARIPPGSIQSAHRKNVAVEPG